MHSVPAEAHYSLVRHQTEERLVRLEAEQNLANFLVDQGRYAEAEQMQRDSHALQMRALGTNKVKER
jgi:hypothetical protein